MMKSNKNIKINSPLNSKNFHNIITPKNQGQGLMINNLNKLFKGNKRTISNRNRNHNDLYPNLKNSNTYTNNDPYASYFFQSTSNEINKTVNIN